MILALDKQLERNLFIMSISISIEIDVCAITQISCGRYGFAVDSYLIY